MGTRTRLFASGLFHVDANLKPRSEAKTDADAAPVPIGFVRTGDVDVDRLEGVLSGRGVVWVMDRGDLAPGQRHRADTAHPVDLDVVTLGFQVVDGGTGRLGAGYRPHRLGGGDGHVGKG